MLLPAKQFAGNPLGVVLCPKGCRTDQKDEGHRPPSSISRKRLPFAAAEGHAHTAAVRSLHALEKPFAGPHPNVGTASHLSFHRLCWPTPPPRSARAPTPTTRAATASLEERHQDLVPIAPKRRGSGNGPGGLPRQLLTMGRKFRRMIAGMLVRSTTWRPKKNPHPPRIAHAAVPFIRAVELKDRTAADGDCAFRRLNA